MDKGISFLLGFSYMAIDEKEHYWLILFSQGRSDTLRNKVELIMSISEQAGSHHPDDIWENDKHKHICLTEFH